MAYNKSLKSLVFILLASQIVFVLFLCYGKSSRELGVKWNSDIRSWMTSYVGFNGETAAISEEQLIWAEKIPDYNEEIVVRLHLEEENNLSDILQKAQSQNLDIWDYNFDHVDLRLKEENFDFWKSQYRSDILINNLTETLFESIVPDTTNSPFSTEAFLQAVENGHLNYEMFTSFTDIFFKSYQNLESINSWLRLMASLYKDLSELVPVGITAEGRTILGLKLNGRHPSDNGEKIRNKKVIIIQGGSHAREWIGIPSVCYAAWQLLAKYDSDGHVRKLLDKFEWIFIPVLNVDGYEYTWSNDRLWSKNRQPLNNSECFGINLDANWAFGFNGNIDPCSNEYGGLSPFQANETMALFNLITESLSQEQKKVVGFLDVHSYSQSVLWPYAYTCDLFPPDTENFEELAIGLVKELHRVNSRYYTYQQACIPYDGFHKHYLPGTAIDWVYFAADVAWPFNIRLRDMGDYGYLLPAKQIVPTAKEFFAMILYYGEFIAEYAF
ncbi:Carboxypeptidase [Schizosaccharomyces pombe]